MKEDLRVQRTKHMIRKAFLELLGEKSFAEVTITEITEAAFCNRNTFYLHYEDKYALMESLCDEAVARLTERLEDASQTDYPSKEDFYTKVPDICMTLMDEDILFYTNVFARNGYPAFEAKYRQAIINYIFKSYKLKKVDIKKKRMEVEYAISGLIGAHRYWLQHHDEYSRADVFELFKDLSVQMGKIIFEQ